MLLGSAINSLLINYLLLLLPDKHNGISYSLSIILYLFPDISLCHDKVKFQINIFTNCLEISYTLVILPFKMFPDAATLNVSNGTKIDILRKTNNNSNKSIMLSFSQISLNLARMLSLTAKPISSSALTFLTCKNF